MIRVNRCKNLTLIQELAQQVFEPSDIPTKLSESRWFVAWEGGVPLGFAGITFWGNGKAFLSLAGVLAEHRGRGIQKRLIQARLRYAKKWKVHQVVTYTVVNNPESMRSLIRCGMLPYTPKTKWAGHKVVYFST